MMLIPTGFAIQFMVQTGKEMEEPLFLTHIRNHMMQVSAESLASYEEGEVIYRKGDHLHGYVFQGNLILGFTHYGQIKKGASVLLTKNKERYRLTVRPVSGLVSLKKE
ncbi:MAG TPA: hypothetical protein P5107_10625 [Thermotogota bacterium]|nr:hypothetical protein [Thermotogota bacterium]HRW35497.1 hypothetical protein [Thermotogota bacterium]